MSQRNSEAEGMGFALAVIGAGIFLLCFILYAVVCFLALAMTLVMLWAWDQDRRIGSLTITREEARCFLYGGAAGAAILPIFLLFCAALLKSHIPETWWSYVFLGGYSFGALGVSGIAAYQEEQAKEQAAKLVIEQAELVQAQPVYGLPDPDITPEDGANGFRFASWDDEEFYYGEDGR